MAIWSSSPPVMMTERERNRQSPCAPTLMDPIGAPTVNSEAFAGVSGGFLIVAPNIRSAFGEVLHFRESAQICLVCRGGGAKVVRGMPLSS